MNLKGLRRKIDAIDKKIVGLLEKRAEVVLKVAAEKKKEKAIVYHPGREKEIIGKVKKMTKQLPPDVVERIFGEMISSFRSLQKPMTVGFLGPKATFTEMATIKHFGSSANLVPLHSITDIFKETEKGNCDFGVVPIENSNEGSVTSTLDMFFESDLNICGEIVIEVNQNLLSNAKKRKDIKKIYSHPQAIAQSEEWISKNLPNAEIIEVSSTAKAAEMAKKNKKSAAIASKLAAKEYNLKILANKIQERALNKTRFLVVGKIKPERTGKDKTSIVFVTKDIPGALFKSLKPFDDAKINLTKIESRPIKGRLWEYAFFVDFQGHREDKKVINALKKLGKICLYVKVLGSYPESS